MKFTQVMSKKAEQYFGLFVFSGTVLTVAIALSRWHYYFDNLSAFVVPCFYASLVGIVWGTFFVRRRRKTFILMFLLLLIHTVAVLPWLDRSFIFKIVPVSGVEATKKPLKIALANVKTENREFQKVVDWVRAYQPDVLVMIETDQDWIDAILPLADQLPYVMGSPQEDNFGMAVWSRFPLLDQKVENFSATTIPSLSVRIEHEGQSIRLLATHTLPPVSARGFKDRNQHLQRIAKWSKQQSGNVIVAGDLNIAMWSPYYQDFEITSDLKNTRRGMGLLPTWPTGLAAALRTPIDHVFLKGNLSTRAIRIGPSTGSDHMPLEVEVDLK